MTLHLEVTKLDVLNRVYQVTSGPAVSQAGLGLIVADTESG